MVEAADPELALGVLVARREAECTATPTGSPGSAPP